MVAREPAARGRSWELRRGHLGTVAPQRGEALERGLRKTSNRGPEPGAEAAWNMDGLARDRGASRGGVPGIGIRGGAAQERWRWDERTDHCETRGRFHVRS